MMEYIADYIEACSEDAEMSAIYRYRSDFLLFFPLSAFIVSDGSGGHVFRVGDALYRSPCGTRLSR